MSKHSDYYTTISSIIESLSCLTKKMKEQVQNLIFLTLIPSPQPILASPLIWTPSLKGALMQFENLPMLVLIIP